MSDIENITCPADEPSVDHKSQYGVAEDLSSLNRIHDDSFITILDLPKCLRDYNYSACADNSPISLDSMELNVKNFNIPSITVNTHKTGFGAGSVGLSSHKLAEPEDVTIQFKLSPTMVNYNTIYQWLNMLVDMEKGVVGNHDKNEYSTTYTVFCLDQYKKPVGAFTFHGVIPTTLGSIPLDNTSNGSPIFLDFTFSFDYLTFEKRTDIA